MKRLRTALLTSLVVLSTPAHASLFGEENGPLTTLVVQSASQISQLSEAIATAKETYDETKKYVGMAQDAVNVFTEMKSFGDSVINSPDRALASLFPALGSIQGELSTPDTWRQGTGELQRRVRLCLAGSKACGEFYERLQGQQAQQAITRTYGTVPANVKRIDIEATDSEASAALVVSSIHQGKAEVSRQQYDALIQKCLGSPGSDADMTSCQAAANMAEILQAKGTADLNEQMATSNRLQATQLATSSAAQKREVREAQERANAVLNGFDDLGKHPLIKPGTVPASTGDVSGDAP
jgi:hypothetical protein